MTKPDWSLISSLRESGGRLAAARLRSLVSAADLADQISAFERRGYRLERAPRGALVLAAVPRRIFAEEISSALHTEVIGRRVEVHWSVKSTQDNARAEAEAGREGAVIFAEEQTGGRGRFGRAWAAPRFSSLLFSFPLEIPQGGDACRPERMALACAAAVAEALIQEYNLPARVKWPNDVLIEGRKVAGILVERMTRARSSWLIVGIGVNVNLDLVDLPEPLRETAGSLSHFLKRPLDRARLARAILRRLDAWWGIVKSGDTARLCEASRELSSLVGTFITVESGGKRHTGRVVDVDADAGLILQLNGGPTRAFAPGDTTIVKQS